MKKKIRKERPPLGGLKLKLSAPLRNGFERRWFNDKGSRIQEALGAGYEFVRDTATQEDMNEDKSRIRKLVGTQEGGQPQFAYLMETKESWYKQDQKAKQSEIDETESAIKDGYASGQAEQSNRYVPKGGISIKHSS